VLGGGPGAAFLFDGISGELLHTFENPSGQLNSFFGKSLASDGSNILIGADSFNAFGKTNTGAAYLITAEKVAAVPEPSTLLLLASGLVGLGAWRWKQGRGVAIVYPRFGGHI